MNKYHADLIGLGFHYNPVPMTIYEVSYYEVVSNAAFAQYTSPGTTINVSEDNKVDIFTWTWDEDEFYAYYGGFYLTLDPRWA
jgi:hypothetical protein